MAGAPSSPKRGVWREPVDALQKGLVELAIAPSIVGRSMRTHPTTTVDFVSVVAADHPLAKLPGPVPLESLQGYRRLVLTADGHLPEEANQRMGATWRLDNAATRHGLLLQGVGWARLIRWQVEEDLATGRLVALEIDGWIGTRQVELAVMVDSTRPAGPAARWLYDFLASHGP
ncbi:MAG: substrate-binding domain-containing protein [Myxococcota bacterium]